MLDIYDGQIYSQVTTENNSITSPRHTANMKVDYPIKYEETAEPPPRRSGTIARWSEVCDKLDDLCLRGGVIRISCPRDKVQEEIHSVRRAVYRHRLKYAPHLSAYVIHIQLKEEGDGIMIWASPKKEDKRVRGA